MRAAALLSAAAPCTAHVAMNYPPSWSDPDGQFGLKEGPIDDGDKSDWRNAGCIKGTGRGGNDGTNHDAKHCIMKWYTNYTFIPGKRTLPTDMEGYHPIVGPTNPWYAPGTAPVVGGGCGVDGGNPHGCPPGNPKWDDCAGGGRGNGDDARTLKYTYKKVTEWKVGETVELVYGIEANHAGGYQYRLCKKPASNMDLTEECFQKMPLTLTTDKAFVQWHGDRNNRTAFVPKRTTTGTTPAGSQWSRQAIPDCGSADGGVIDFNCRGGKAMFTPPAPGAYGFWGVYNLGNPSWGTGRVWSLSVVDMLEVPDVPKGLYVLSFRYDGEQTSQVWNSCADVQIV